MSFVGRHGLNTTVNIGWSGVSLCAPFLPTRSVIVPVVYICVLHYITMSHSLPVCVHTFVLAYRSFLVVFRLFVCFVVVVFVYEPT